MSAIDFGRYQEQAKRTAVYPVAMKGEIVGKDYVALGLCGEAGEVANQVKKIHRDDNTSLTDDRKRVIRDELGDVLWYVAMICNEFGFSMEVVAQANLDKLADRAERGALHGDRRVDGRH
jgi:NTP pyrophosphatase (non-canonical NTP hydrolase)